MCRLLGMISKANSDVIQPFFKADRPFKNFRNRQNDGKDHGDGWGIGFYKNGSVEIFKQGLDDVLSKEKYNYELVKQVKSNIIIVHFRRATPGLRKTRDFAHPFNYNHWIFAHNGSIENKKLLYNRLNSEHKEQISSVDESYSDSLVLFHFLLQEIKNGKDQAKELVKAIGKVRGAVNYTGLNFLLADGKSLFVFRDAQKKRNYYTLFFLQENDRVLISSEILTYDDEWSEIPLNTLLHIDEDCKVRRFSL